jgi:hypothetical protein
MKKSKYIISLLVLALFLNTFALAKQPNPDQIRKIGEEAYLYGLQQVIFFGQRWISTQNNSKDNKGYTGINRFSWVREKITPDFPIVTPNATTLYGSAVLDLQSEPVVLEMPEIADRYFSAQCMDQYGIFYVMVGNQFNGVDARSYIFLPVDYTGRAPAEFVTTDVIQAPSNIGYCLVRIALMTGTDEEIRKINSWQDQITFTPMSQWIANGNKGVPQSEAKLVPGNYKEYSGMNKIALQQVDKQSAKDFFTILNMVLNDPSMTLIPDSIKEADMLAQLETLGIGKGKDFEWSNLDKTTQDALTTGFKDGFNKVRTALKSNLINLNGWMEVRNSGGFETRWMDRAVMADAGWAGPDRNVSHAGAFLFVDEGGNPLDGKNKYTITFDMNDLPPVTQFWSIPIYNKDGYFVENEIGRYTINSFMLDQEQLHVEDSNLVIYVQNEKPSDPDKLKNWLPAPEGSFRFTARFYGPKMSIVDGSYKMPKPVIVK